MVFLECYGNPFLSLADKRIEGFLFLRREKHCTANTIHYMVWHTVKKTTVKIIGFTRSLALMKNSFRGRVGVVKLKMIWSYQIFLVRRQIFDFLDIFFAISQHSRYNSFMENVFTFVFTMFLLLFMTLEYPLILEIHL